MERIFPFWGELAQPEQEALRRGCIQSAHPKGTLLHRFDRDCRGVLLVTRGQLRVYLLSPEGREVTLYRIREGEVCVMSSSCLMDAILFEVLIEAAADVELLTVPSSVLAPILRDHPAAELFLYKTAAERFSGILWTMQQILFLGVDRRVAIFLWEEYGKSGPAIRITHDEIARNIGSAREVVTRVLQYFVGEGILSLSRGKVDILDADRLRRLAECETVTDPARRIR
ncbi:MAG: Crp/Fnr family transcriptional regulator [Oscillospiraceae bacterium]|nr:MAG: Crp/Fnr family transcriptional regulator [Oscillospiraceae bacterium]